MDYDQCDGTSFFKHDNLLGNLIEADKKIL